MRTPFKTDPGLAGLLGDYRDRIEILERNEGGPGYVQVTDVDVYPPVISNLTHATTPNSATVSFITDEQANGTVWYGTDAAADDGFINTGINQVFHQAVISGLTDNTTYYYYIVAEDPSGNQTTSPKYTFVTVVDTSQPADPPPTGGGGSTDPPPVEATDTIIGTYEAETATLVVVTDPGTPPPTGTGTGKFEINAQGRIVDPAGNKWRGLGANGSVDVSGGGPFIFNMPVVGGSGRETFTNHVADLQNWGWNCVRCVVLTNGSYSRAVNVAAVKQFVDQAAAAGIVTIVGTLEAQDSTTNPTISDPIWNSSVLPFFQDLLAAVAPASLPYLWVNPAMEAREDTNFSAWSGLEGGLYNSIRAMPGGANVMFSATTYAFGQSPVTVSEWNTFASGKHHVILDWHTYAAPGDAAWHEARRLELRAGNVPFMVNEFGFQTGGGTCCGGTYANQRAVALQNINTWYSVHGETVVGWIGTSDTNTQAGYAMRNSPPNNGGYLAYTLPLSEYGNTLWNARTLSKNY